MELDDGIDGLVHVSDLSWTKHISHPKEFIRKNDTVDVIVLEVSKKDHKLSLGIKQLEENPWENIKSMYSSGDSVDGKFVNLLDDKIIVKFDNDIEGYVYTKDIDKNLFRQFSDLLNEDYVLKLTIQEVDDDNQQIIALLKDDIEDLMPESNEDKEDSSQQSPDSDDSSENKEV